LDNAKTTGLWTVDVFGVEVDSRLLESHEHEIVGLPCVDHLGFLRADLKGGGEVAYLLEIVRRWSVKPTND
jgi:hypothetical protein